jgi:hypothetical protein
MSAEVFRRPWYYTQAFGASLKSFEILGRQSGYSLVRCDLVGVNAFFVRDDLLQDRFVGPFTAANHYEPPRSGLCYRWAHPSGFFGEGQYHNGFNDAVFEKTAGVSQADARLF